MITVRATNCCEPPRGDNKAQMSKLQGECVLGRMEVRPRPSVHVPKQQEYMSVFSAPANYGVVKIVRSSFDVVLQTIKHTMIFPGSGPSSEVIVLHPVI
jgi:hypothetical protein